MNFFLGIIIGLKEVWAHKLRSLLTTLGVILGVASLVCVFAMVAGLFKQSEEFLYEMGGLERVDVRLVPASGKGEARAALSPGLTLDDARALTRCSLIARVSPSIQLATANVTYRNKEARPGQIQGITPAALTIERREMAHGRFITDLDLDRFHSVCVLGTSVSQELFGSATNNAIGQSIFINGEPFTVIGQLTFFETAAERQERLKREDEEQRKSDQEKAQAKKKAEKAEDRWWRDWRNNVIFVPLTTARYKFADGNGPLKITGLSLSLCDVNHLDLTVSQARNILLGLHRGVEDFHLDTRREWSSGIANWRLGFNIGGGIIAGISLIVGGIGIMNIMLASIHERVREFGIHKAIGAKPRDIFMQVLAEGVVLSGFGGLMGVLLAVAIVTSVGHFMPGGFLPVVQPHSVLIAFSFSVAVGLTAGIFPAWKAARLDPIAALRYE